MVEGEELRGGGDEVFDVLQHALVMRGEGSLTPKGALEDDIEVGDVK